MNVSTKAVLRAKGRFGNWDPRMLDFYPVGHNINWKVKRAIVRGWKYGVVPTATTNGTHAPGSYHSLLVNGLGHGVDFGLVPAEIGTDRGLRRLKRFQKSEHERFVLGGSPDLMELIGPDNGLIVLRGQRTGLVEGTPLETQHDNHVHEGYAP